MAKSTARRIQENAEAHAHYYSLVWRSVDGSFLKDEIGSIVVGYVAHNPGQLRFVARTRGYTRYQIVHTLGKNTPIKKGEIIFDDTQDTERKTVSWWAD